MPLPPGTRLGPYEIIAPLGAGGMGEVYRARDTRLSREVAVKVLPEHLSANPEIRARFEREAKTVSSLNHPNICTLFDVGREGDVDFLVLELVEGETLAQRLTRGPLPTPDVLRVGGQIADALDRAHRAGVVHRDLKPANVMLTRAGAKLMDFGLARAGTPAGGSRPHSLTMEALTQSPTMATPLTAEGTIVGTFQYMAPEQLEGKEADARSDLWALGCVLYEMATGRRAFEGRSQASLIGAIMGSQPAPITQVVPLAPAALERLVSALLAKDPEERLQTAHDARLQLQWAGEAAGISGIATAPATAPAETRGDVRRERNALRVVALVAVIAALASLVWSGTRTRPRPAVFRFEVPTIPGATDTYWPRVSPDGRSLLMIATDTSRVDRAWIRPMDQTQAHPIAGSEGLLRPYWSPDGKEIAFVQNGKLVRLPIAGGVPQVISSATGRADLSWGSRGIILVDASTTDSLRSVPAAGGELKPAVRIDRTRNEIGSAWPFFLPDGEHFLFIGLTTTADQGGDIRLGRLGSLDSQWLGHSDGRVEYAPGDWVVYMEGTTLLARKLDLARARLTGEPITLATELRTGLTSGYWSVSPSGTLAFAPAGGAAEVGIVAVDRHGQALGPPFAIGSSQSPQVSPRGDLVLSLRATPGVGQNLWIHDLVRGSDTGLTGDGRATPAVWSPDGRRVAWIEQPLGARQVVMIAPADGSSGADSIPLSQAKGLLLNQWAAAGDRFVFWSRDVHGLYTVPTSGSARRLSAMGDSSETIAHAVVSPDGRYLAYVTGTTPSDPEVYVRTLVGPPARWQISKTTGIEPQWTRDGKEIVYEERPNGRMFAAMIDTRGGFHAGDPQYLFTLPTPSPTPFESSWGVTADGTRFYVVTQSHVAGVGFEVLTDVATLLGTH